MLNNRLPYAMSGQHHFVELHDRLRRMSFDLPEAAVMQFARGGNRAERGRNFTDDAVQHRLAHRRTESRISSRISASGTIGTSRNTMKNRVENSPIEPAKIAQSHSVGE